MGRATFHVEPWADLSVDGNPLGEVTADLTKLLPAGPHTAVFDCDGEKITRHFTITAEKTARVTATFPQK